jgi:hypothetical protein
LRNGGGQGCRFLLSGFERRSENNTPALTGKGARGTVQCHRVVWWED